MVITIGGHYGSGGKRIAERLASLLEYRLCDDEIIIEAVKSSGVDMEEETFRYFDESRGSGSIAEMKRQSSVQRMSYLGAISTLSLDVTPLDRSMAQVQEKIIRSLASEGNCILMGRCADYYLRDFPNVLSIFVIDDEESCIARVMEHFPKLDEKEAKRLIRRTDKRRADYYAFFTQKSWGNPSNYDMVLSCSRLGGAELVSEMLAAGIRVKES